VSKKKAKKKKPTNRQKTGFRGPSPDVGKATQFKPGQSGNPNGRPKSKPFTDALIKAIQDDPSQVEKIAKAMLKKMRAGSVKHFTAVTDRVEGRPVQPIEGTGENGVLELLVRNVGRNNKSGSD